MTWRKMKLAELVENFSVKAKYNGGSDGLVFLGVSNEDGITKSKYAAEAKAEDYKIIERGCFAYNPYRINVGSIAYLNEDIKGLVSPAYVLFKTKPEIIKDELLFRFLKSSEGIRQIKFYGRGTVRQALRFEDLCKIEISIPEYGKQEEMLEKLKMIDDEAKRLGTELDNQLILLSRLRQAFLKKAMQGKLIEQNPNDEPATELLKKSKAEKEKLVTDKKIKKGKELSPVKKEEVPFDIPESWVWCKLGEICDFITKGTTPDTNKISSEGQIPYLKVYNIVNQKIDFDYKPQFIDAVTHRGELSRSIVYPGDVLMNIVGPPLGKVAIVPNQYAEWNINQALAIFRPIVLEINRFLYHYLIEGSEIQKLRPLGVVGQDNLSLEQCRNIIFPLPPIAEQRRIVKKLKQLMNSCNKLEESISQSQKYNEQLLQQVLKEALTAPQQGELKIQHL